MGAGICFNPYDPNSQWLYCPSFGAAILFAVLFGLCSVAHIAQAFIFRKKFCWVIIMACLWETAGFVVRVLGTTDQANGAYSTAQQLLVILAPLWINAFSYMVLGRMIYFFSPDQKAFGVKATRLTLLFVLLDITAFVVQGGGASLLDNTDPHLVQIGLHVYMGGVGLQEFFVIVFFLLAVSFQRKVQRIDTGRRTRWKPLLYTLYASLSLITIRVIFRLVEFSQGVYSTVPMHEVFFYCFDALPMFTAIILFNVTHPGKVLVGPDSEFPKKEKKKSRKEKLAEKLSTV